MSIQFSTILDGVTKKKDGTLTIKLGTQELGAEDTAQIFEMGGRQIWCALSDLPVKPEDIDIPEKVLEVGDKSPSQRLRSVLYLLGKQEGVEDSDDFYRKQMSKIIEYVKDKLA